MLFPSAYSLCFIARLLSPTNSIYLFRVGYSCLAYQLHMIAQLPKDEEHLLTLSPQWILMTELNPAQEAKSSVRIAGVAMSDWIGKSRLEELRSRTKSIKEAGSGWGN